jgi:hypothetical protein
MPELTFGLRRGRGPLSALIGLTGHFSHVDVLSPDGKWWWGARSDEVFAKGCDWPRGFQRRPVGYNPHEELWHFSMRVPDDIWDDFWYTPVLGTLAQEGKPYDWAAVLAFCAPDFLHIRRNWRDPSCWFCSEEQPFQCERSHIFGSLWGHPTGIPPGTFAQMLAARGFQYRRIAP